MHTHQISVYLRRGEVGWGWDGVEIVVADLSQKSATGAVKADVVAGSHTEVALPMGTGRDDAGGRGKSSYVNNLCV